VCPNCGAKVAVRAIGPGRPVGYPPSVRIYRLDGLGSTLLVLLGISAVVSLVGIAIRPAVSTMELLGLPLLIVFLVWFYRARQNAGHLDWPQRWPAGWSVVGWFVPICFFWIPYRIMADIWRAGVPAQERAKLPVVLIGWWACWCLAWFTGYRTTTVTSPSPAPGSPPPTFTTTTTTHSLAFGGTVPSLLFAAAAAALLAHIVRHVSAGPVGAVGRF
jgi:hypothetical protein